MTTNQLLHLTGETKGENLSGTYFKGTQYYDMARVDSINNSGIADLIDLVKAWTDLGIEVRFVNVNSRIKNTINELDLENIIFFET